MTIVFVSVANNQSEFFVLLAEEMKKRGYKAVVLNFHEKSMSLFTDAGIEAYNIPRLGREIQSRKRESFAEICKSLSLEDPHPYFVHENYCNEISSNRELEKKVEKFIPAVRESLGKIRESSTGKVLIFQELGGFVSVLFTYIVARNQGIDNYFIEPSFFRGRVFFTRNSLRAPKIVRHRENEIQEELKTYIEENLAKKSIVIPTKDVRHYDTALGKLTSLHNIRRLVEKTIDKYVSRNDEEFNYLWLYVRRTLRMALNSLRLKPLYSSISSLKNFVYYPLHVPADFALTVRSMEYMDQYMVLEYLAKAVPYGRNVAFKEHPAQVGGVDYYRVKQLLKRNQNLVLLDPNTNNFDVMANAESIVTINSKSGAEALSQGKKCFVLGDAFYRDSGLVEPVDSLPQLRRLLHEGSERSLEASEILKYFQDVWDSSFPGEVFFCGKENVAQFAKSMENCLSRS